MENHLGHDYHEGDDDYVDNADDEDDDGNVDGEDDDATPPRSSRGPSPCHNLHWRENRDMYPGKPEKGDQDDDVDGICLSSNSVYMDPFPLISCAQ